MKVLILTGKFGMGHMSAAQAVKAQLDTRFPGAETAVVDFLSYALKSDVLYKGFALLVRHGEKMFNRFYYRSDAEGESFGIPCKRICFAAFSRLLEKHQPDVVVSTLPLTSQLAGQYKAEHGCAYTFISCITDTSLHNDWVAPGTDAYMAPALEARAQLLAAGVPAHKIFVTGVPLRPGFHPPAAQAGPRGRRHLLILGGGLGLINEDMGFFQKLSRLPDVDITVLCGGNRELYATLDGLFPNIRPVGYVDNVGDFMREADLALGKPGGVSLYEAVACRLPFLSQHPFLAQEIHNAAFIERHGLGRVLPQDEAGQLAQIESALWDDDFAREARKAMDSLEAGLDREALLSVVHAAMLARTAA